MNGIDVYDLPCAQTVRLLYSCVIDNSVSMEASRQHVAEELDKRLADVTMMWNGRKMAAAKAAGRKPDSSLEPAPFALTPQMQQALGLQIPTGSGQ